MTLLLNLPSLARISDERWPLYAPYAPAFSERPPEEPRGGHAHHTPLDETCPPPTVRLIRHRLYRDTTTFAQGFHRKDLDALNRDLGKVVW